VPLRRSGCDRPACGSRGSRPAFGSQPARRSILGTSPQRPRPAQTLGMTTGNSSKSLPGMCTDKSRGSRTLAIGVQDVGRRAPSSTIAIQVSEGRRHHLIDRRGDVGRPRHSPLGDRVHPNRSESAGRSPLTRRVTVTPQRLSASSDESKCSRFRLICPAEIRFDPCTFRPASGAVATCRAYQVSSGFAMRSVAEKVANSDKNVTQRLAEREISH
jgi:hypothetical protein